MRYHSSKYGIIIDMLWLVGQRTVCLSTVIIHAQRRAAGKSNVTLAHKISILTSFIVSKYVSCPILLSRNNESQNWLPNYAINSINIVSWHPIFAFLIKSSEYLFIPLPSPKYNPSLSLLYWYPLSSFLLQKSYDPRRSVQKMSCRLCRVHALHFAMEMA